MRNATKLLVTTFACILLLTCSSFGADVVLHDDYGTEYSLGDTGIIIDGNLVYTGPVAHAGVIDQECIATYNPAFGEVLISALPNDLYYGSTLIGVWGVAGSFQFTVTNGYYELGLSLYLGPALRAGANPSAR